MVCDIEMPMGNGTELLKWIRENDMSSEFLFLTCHTEFQYASVAIRYQAAGYLVKPFRVEQVEAELFAPWSRGSWRSGKIERRKALWKMDEK